VRIAVIGAGIQGVCTALELAAAGAQVDLYEAEQDCLTQASLHNEGKLHLGYIYAMDSTLATAGLMVRGALSFESLLSRLDVAVSDIAVSAPFNYAVARTSLLEPDAFAAHLQATHRLVGAARPAPYFGSDLEMTPQRVSPDGYDERAVAAVFRTAEIAIDPRSLCAVLRARLLEDPRIHLRCRTPVQAVRPDRRGLVVGSAAGSETYDHVVNAAWVGRLAVDASLGLYPDQPWLFRWKDFMLAPGGAAGAPCTTIVLGPFGDVVAYPGGDFYLSWYPVGLRGATGALRPQWTDREDPAALRRELLAGLQAFVPGVSEIDADQGTVGGGVIFAWGRTDIDDPASGLHERHAVGPRTHGNFHSVDTGKLTTAPLFARVLAERIVGIGRVAS
jgi:glycine/D-amino acid oxidase-like deaminating enzyme